MDAVSTRISQLTPSQTLAITNEARKLREAGHDVCGFGAGEPDHNTPDHIVQAAAQALVDGETRYIQSAGLPELREAISEKLLLENGLEYNASQICVNTGAKHSCFNALLACCEDDDEVIIPAPYWTSYPEMVKMTGAEPKIVQTKQENGWKLTPEEFEGAMSPCTKMIILNSPANPHGAVYTEEELLALGEVALSEDILILSDEIYEKLVYGEAKHVSIASLSPELYDLTITVNGFSKAYAMTGWRLGYTAAPYEIAKAINTIQSHSTSNATTFAQYGAIAAIKGDQEIISDMREEFDTRRQFMKARLDAIDNISTVEPEGAFYFLVNIEKTGLSSANLAEKLLSRYHVAVVPGEAFGCPGTVRFSYACGLDVINDGLERFEDFCKSF